MTDKEWNEKVFEMYQSEGWKLLKTQILESEESMKEKIIKEGNQVDFLRGHISHIRWLISFEELVVQALEQIDEDA
jgi:hypothetical protein